MLLGMQRLPLSLLVGAALVLLGAMVMLGRWLRLPSVVRVVPEFTPMVFYTALSFGARSSRGQEGSGLGLHLSHKLAGLLGGSIAVRSDYGKGSTFTLLLPKG
jgi:hypothetical protein